MSEPVVQPQFRPTANDLVGDRWRALSRWVRWPLIAIGLLFVFWQVGPNIRGRGERNVLVVRGANPVNFLWTHPLVPVKPAPGEMVALQAERSYGEYVRFAVRPLTLPRYGGDPGAQLLLASVGLERYLEAKHPGLIIRNEGRTRINLRPGYQITWQTQINGHTAYGRDIMVVDDVNAARVGATLEMVSVFSPHVPNANSLGRINPLKLSLRSFRLGTERP
jgi:hypothetical protein